MNGRAIPWRSRERRQAAARLDVPTADRIPYSAHVTGSIVRTWNGDYLQTFRLAGASFESADDVAVNAWHQRLNVLWRNIAAIFTDERMQWGGLVQFWHDIYVPYFIGALLPGFVISAVAYYVTIPIVQAYQKARAAKYDERTDRRRKLRATVAEAAARLKARNEKAEQSASGDGGDAAP